MRHFLFFVFLCCSGSLFAQSVTISFVPSVSIPLSDFGDTDFENELANYADLGFGGNIEATFWLVPSFGISALAGTYGNKIDSKTLAEQLNEEFGAEFTVTDDTYTILYAMLGPTLGMNSRSVSISLHPAVGYGIKSALSYQAFLDNASNDSQQIDLESDSGLMYGLQFSTKFFISEGFGLGFNASYLSGNMQNLGERSATSILPAEVIEQDFSPTVVTAGINLSFRIGGRDTRHRPGAGFYFGR